MIVTLTGCTASGKTSIARRLLEEIPGASMVVSLTTRPPRVSDIPGEYQHVTHETFTGGMKQGLFEWTVPYNEHWYGTRTKDLRAAILERRKVHVMILALDVVTKVRQFMKKQGSLEEHKPFFIYAPLDERRIRAVERDGSDALIKSRADKERYWPAWMDNSATPFIRIENVNGMLERSIGEIRSAIGR